MTSKQNKLILEAAPHIIKGAKRSATKPREKLPDPVSMTTEALEEFIEAERKKRNEYKARWREKHRQEIREYSRKWVADHPEAIRQYQKKWRENHPHYGKLRWQRYIDELKRRKQEQDERIRGDIESHKEGGGVNE